MGIDELVQFLLVGLDPLVPVFIGGIFVLEDVQVDIAVAGMAGDARDQVIFLGQAKDFIEEGCFLVDRDDDVFFADDEAFGTDGFGKGLAGLPNLVVEGPPRQSLKESYDCCDYIIVLDEYTLTRLIRVFKIFMAEYKMCI